MTYQEFKTLVLNLHAKGLTVGEIAQEMMYRYKAEGYGTLDVRRVLKLSK